MKKTDSLFPGAGAPQVGVGACEHLSSMLECWPARSCVGLVQDSTAAVTARDTVGQRSSDFSLLLSLHLHLPMFPELEWKGYDIVILLRAKPMSCFSLQPLLNLAAHHSCVNSAVRADVQ